MSDKKTMTIQEVHDRITELLADPTTDPNSRFLVGVPYRNGLGLHYEGVVNISSHSGIFDMYTTVPDEDDIKKRH